MLFVFISSLSFSQTDTSGVTQLSSASVDSKAVKETARMKTQLGFDSVVAQSVLQINKTYHTKLAELRTMTSNDSEVRKQKLAQAEASRFQSLGSVLSSVQLQRYSHFTDSLKTAIKRN